MAATFLNLHDDPFAHFTSSMHWKKIVEAANTEPKPLAGDMSARERIFHLAKLYVLVLAIVFGTRFAIRVYREMPEHARNTTNSAMSVVFGAIVAAITIYVGQAFYERRKRRRELLAQVPSFAYNATAILMELYAVQKAAGFKEKPPILHPEFARVARLEGEAGQFELEWRAAFRGRRARAAINKLRRRVIITKDYLLNSQTVSPDEMEQAIYWVLEQAERTAQLSASEARLSFVDRGGIQFIGFRKLTDEDRLDLSFADTPPPWAPQSERPARKQK